MDFLLIFSTVLATGVTLVNAEGTLQLVNIVYRHGDRSPIVIYPTDRNQIDQWPQGLGWLSKIGIQQHHALGQWLKQRYIDTGFMSAEYKRSEIEILSSDEDRCLMSAYSNLAGLFPPNENQTFIEDIKWQPIPVHTRPTYEDNMLNMGKKCPRYDQLLAQTMKTHAIKQEEKANKKFYAFIGEKTKWDHENISNIWRVADTAYCEKCHNLTMDPWYETRNASWGNMTVYDKLRKLESYSFTLLFNGSEQSMLKGGPLLKQYIQNMHMKMENKTSIKMFMYSAHDTTVAALLSAMGLFNDISPQYASAVIVELHKGPNGYFVNLIYKNETYSNETVALTLPKCEFNCSVTKFEDILQFSVPNDWDAQCGVPSPKPDSKTAGLAIGWIVSIVLGCLLLILVVLGVVCMLHSRRKNSNFLYGKFDAST